MLILPGSLHHDAACALKGNEHIERVTIITRKTLLNILLLYRESVKNGKILGEKYVLFGTPYYPRD